MDISVVGAGHVGLVTGACFADLGHSVVIVDNDAARTANLKRGLMPYYEPGLEELVARGVREQRLTFTTSIREGVAKSTMIFIDKNELEACLMSSALFMSVTTIGAPSGL